MVRPATTGLKPTLLRRHHASCNTAKCNTAGRVSRGNPSARTKSWKADRLPGVRPERSYNPGWKRPPPENSSFGLPSQFALECAQLSLADDGRRR
jgi:hypothetical protein